MMFDHKIDFVIVSEISSILKNLYLFGQWKLHDEISVGPEAITHKSRKLMCDIARMTSDRKTDFIVASET